MTDKELVGRVDAIRDAGGLNAKTEALTELLATEEGRALVNLCYNPFITYGVTHKKEPKWTAGGDGDDPSQFSAVRDLLDNLAARSLTGNAAKEAVESAFASLNPDAGKLLWLCLNKDLKAGVNTASIKAVMPDLFPVFAVMRAHPYEEKRVTKFPVAIEPKLDGFRVTFIAKDGSGGFFTRTGKVMPALDHMVGPVLNVLKEWLNAADPTDPFYAQVTEHNGVPNIVLDGEMMTDGGFNDTSGALRRESEEANAYYNIFDCLTWEEFDAMGSVEVTYVERRKRVRTIVYMAQTTGYEEKLRETQVRIARSHDDIQRIYAEHRAEGHEGSMVKDPAGFYDKKKSYGWQKIKNEDTEDLQIVGVFQGQAGGKYENTIGGLIVDRNGVTVRVSGIDDATRELIWNLWCEDAEAMGISPEAGYGGWIIELFPKALKLLGRLIEVEFHEVTQDGSLRHPRFVRFRDDKQGEVDK